MTQLSTYGHTYLKVSFKNDIHEVGVSYLSWPNPNYMDKTSICIDILTIDGDVAIPDQFVKSALKKHLKSQTC